MASERAKRGRTGNRRRFLKQLGSATALLATGIPDERAESEPRPAAPANLRMSSELAAPTNLAAVVQSASRVVLSWTDNSANEARFRVEFGRATEDVWVSAGTVSANTRSLVVENLRPSTIYKFRVRAENDTLPPSDWSAYVTATTLGSGAAVLLTSVTMTNRAQGSSPARTLLSFGHPFGRGDAPAGSRIRATWRVAGQTEIPVPVQVSSRSSYPSSGSLRFAAIAAEMPSISAGSTGELLLYSEAGVQEEGLPGGRTSGQVATALVAAYDFRVAFRDLYKGRERIRVVEAGSGYPAAGALTISGVDIDGNPQSVNGGTLGSAITYAWSEVPPRPFAGIPAIAFNGTGSGATLTMTIPTREGSGNWSWKLSDQVAFGGWLDARGRTRLEVIESGPLHVTFRAWGPVRDDADGADHPHLAIQAWYRCWLTADGSIDRVEFLHSAEQGWIGDLNGGTTQADMLRADVAVKLNGATVPRRSWTRVLMIHHTGRALTEIGDAEGVNWATAGSDWTVGAPGLVPTFDNYYWRKAGVPHVYDLERFDPTKGGRSILPSADTAPASYTPRQQTPMGRLGYTVAAAAPGTKGWAHQAFNDPGETDGLGFIPQHTARAFLSQEPGYLRSDMATSLFAGHIPVLVKNEVTGRIPVLVPALKLASTPPALMGPDRSGFDSGGNWVGPQLMYSGPGQQYGMSVYVPANGSYADGGENNGHDPENTEGGFKTGGWDSSHWPALAYYACLRTAAPWLLDFIKYNASQQVLNKQPHTNPIEGYWYEVESNFTARTLQLPGAKSPDNRLYGRFILNAGSMQWRSEGRAWQALLQCLAVLPDHAPEKPYFEYVRTENSAAWKKIIDAGSENFRALGSMAIPTAGGWSTQSITTATWEEGIVFAARCFEHLAFEEPANARAFLDFNLRYYRRTAGTYPGDQTCPWGALGYRSIVGIGLNWFPDAAHCPDLIDWDGSHDYWAGGARFDVDGWVYMPNECGSQSNYRTISVGDRLMFHTYWFSRDGASLPTSGTLAGGGSIVPRAGAFYRVVMADVREATGVSADASTNIFTKLGHPFASGDRVSLSSANKVIPAGITSESPASYYIINATANSFQLAAIPGGTPVDLTTSASGMAIAVCRFRLGTDEPTPIPIVSYSAATPLYSPSGKAVEGVLWGYRPGTCPVPRTATEEHAISGLNRTTTILAHGAGVARADGDLFHAYGRARLAVACGLIPPADPFPAAMRRLVDYARTYWAAGEDEFSLPKYAYSDAR